MGSSNWSDDHYHDRAAVRASTGDPVFVHTDNVRKGKTVAGTHDKLNPKGVKLRESRDSDAHPNSHAVAVLFDVTGSMSGVPPILQANLPKLMGLLIRKGFLEHPHVMVGAIGDAYTDRAPLQIGQFEAGIEIENDLANIYLEGNGGGQDMESYDLAMYFMARHTAMDCWEKRQKKGYLFIVGDERFYPKTIRSQVEEVIGDKLQEDIPVEQLVKELQERFHVYYVMPNMTNHYGQASIINPWKKLLGENVLMLEDPAGVSELIAATVGLLEGNVDAAELENELVAGGATAGTARAVKNALVPIAAKAPGKGAAIAVPSSKKGSGLAKL